MTFPGQPAELGPLLRFWPHQKMALRLGRSMEHRAAKENRRSPRSSEPGCLGTPCSASGLVEESRGRHSGTCVLGLADPAFSNRERRVVGGAAVRMGGPGARRIAGPVGRAGVWPLASRFDRPLCRTPYCWLERPPSVRGKSPPSGRNVSEGRFSASGVIRAGTGIIAGFRSRSTGHKCQIRVQQELLGRRRQRKECLRSTPSHSSLPSLRSPSASAAPKQCGRKRRGVPLRLRDGT